MIEIKVAAKEVVKLCFGGSSGWELQERVVSMESFTASEAELVWLRSEKDKAVEHGDGLASECARLREELRAAKEQARCGPSCFSTILRLREKLAAARSKNITLVWPTTTDICELLNKHIGRRLAPEWQSMENAPKDREILLLTGETCRRIVIGNWYSNDRIWFDREATRLEPTHWMPLPEPPR